MALTDTAIRAAKPRDKAYKLGDAGGLYLLVQPSGAKYWRYEFRFRSKRKLLAIGVYPRVSLAEAREARERARRQVGNGEDPCHRRRIEKLAALVSAENTFRAVATEWFEKRKREGRADATLKKSIWLLDFAYAVIGDLPVNEVTAQEVLVVLRKIEARGHYETARRLRSTCGAVFRYAVATGRAQTDPSAALRGALIAPTVTHRAAILEPHRVGALLRDIDGYQGQSATLAALKLAPHVFVRPSELRTAEWSEFDFALAIWTIPAPKTKMRRAHKVPLSHQSMSILSAQREISGCERFVFPAIGAKGRPLSENTLNVALRRLGYDRSEMTTHGFRAMASSLLNETGDWNPDAIERQLAHIEMNGVRRAYARAEFWEERVRMMQYWSDYLDNLRAIRASDPQVGAHAST